MVYLEFIESLIFIRELPQHLDDDSYAALQLHLIRHPYAGRVIKGSGGIRKIRWHRRDEGKSGGVRVCYFMRLTAGKIYLLTIYSKRAHDIIPTKTLNEIRRIIENAENKENQSAT